VGDLADVEGNEFELIDARGRSDPADLEWRLE